MSRIIVNAESCRLLWPQTRSEIAVLTPHLAVVRESCVYLHPPTTSRMREFPNLASIGPSSSGGMLSTQGMVCAPNRNIACEFFGTSNHSSGICTLPRARSKILNTSDPDTHWLIRMLRLMVSLTFTGHHSRIEQVPGFEGKPRAT